MGAPLVIRKDLQAAELRHLTWHELVGLRRDCSRWPTYPTA
jgi:hypothetical protein